MNINIQPKYSWVSKCDESSPTYKYLTNALEERMMKLAIEQNERSLANMLVYGRSTIPRTPVTSVLSKGLASETFNSSLIRTDSRRKNVAKKFKQAKIDRELGKLSNQTLQVPSEECYIPALSSGRVSCGPATSISTGSGLMKFIESSNEYCNYGAHIYPIPFTDIKIEYKFA